MGFSLTKKELAEAAGYSYRHLHNIDLNLPEGAKLFVEGEGKKFDLSVFIQHWVDYCTQNVSEAERGLDEVRASHEAVKMRKTEMEVGRMEGRLVDVVSVRRLWQHIAGTVMQSMIHLPAKLAPMLVMLPSAEKIADVIDKEVRHVLDMLADTPLPDSDDGQDEDEEASEMLNAEG